MGEWEAGNPILAFSHPGFKDSSRIRTNDEPEKSLFERQGGVLVWIGSLCYNLF
jgi:hypothetical protein